MYFYLNLKVKAWKYLRFWNLAHVDNWRTEQCKHTKWYILWWETDYYPYTACDADPIISCKGTSEDTTDYFKGVRSGGSSGGGFWFGLGGHDHIIYEKIRASISNWISRFDQKTSF